MLVAAAAHFPTVVGVDIAFRWLVVAKKRLAAARLDLPLICACAEALPFRAEQFSLVASESTFEQVKDQVSALAESRRVMAPAGRLCLTTPNRFSLGPDPQTGIWVGSWLPEKWTAALVRRQGGIPPQRYLFSARRLRQQLAKTGFDEIQIDPPRIAPAQRANFGPPFTWLIDLHNWGGQLWPLRQMLLWLGPLLNAQARARDLASDERQRMKARATIS
jgi:SAM-dependent methyltransferase